MALEKYSRVHRLEDMFAPDVPYDVDKHTLEGEQANYYPLETCFWAAEELVRSEILQGAVSQKSGREAPNINLENCRLTLIQHGGQQAIFHLTGPDVSFVIGVSRAPALDNSVKNDDVTVSRLRTQEATYTSVPTFPQHYGALRTKRGPYAYLAEFCEGFIETNLTCLDDPSRVIFRDSTQRRVYLNGLNQNTPSRLLEGAESEQILGKIAMHQVVTAVQCQTILAGSLAAGDYLYNPEQDRLMLQCYRNPKQNQNNLWIFVSNILEEIPDGKVKNMAIQLVQLATFAEEYTPPSSDKSLKTYFTYSPTTLAATVTNLMVSDILTREEWSEVVITIDAIQTLGSAFLLGDARTEADVQAVTPVMDRVSLVRRLIFYSLKPV